METDRPDPWSVTKEDLFAAMRTFREEGREAVVASIVDVEGSAYRRPGAKMIIDPDSESLGAITAGCLEGPVTSLAAEVLEDGEPRVHTFDLMDDEEWGLGLGCNGIIDILLEPVEDTWGVALSELAERRPVVTVTAIEAAEGADIAVGDRIVLDEAGAVLADADRGGLPSELVDAVADTREELREKSGAGAATVETASGPIDVFVDWITPAPDLLLFGNQNDVHPVARLGHEAGFRVVVASARGAKSDLADFPNAHDVRATKPADVPETIDAPERTYAVIMSHNALEDMLALDALLDTAVPYVGLMGPRERFEEIREDLRAQEGRELTDRDLERIATPVGLDIGGGEPSQIALSIVAEALAVHNDRGAGRLKDREGPIHTRAPTTD